MHIFSSERFYGEPCDAAHMEKNLYLAYSKEEQ